jgi:hypothetical protein
MGNRELDITTGLTDSFGIGCPHFLFPVRYFPSVIRCRVANCDTLTRQPRLKNNARQSVT